MQMVKCFTKASKKIVEKTPKNRARVPDVAAADDENYDESYREYAARSDLEDFEDDDIPAEHQIRRTFWLKGPWL